MRKKNVRLELYHEESGLLYEADVDYTLSHELYGADRDGNRGAWRGYWEIDDWSSNAPPELQQWALDCIWEYIMEGQNDYVYAR